MQVDEIKAQIKELVGEQIEFDGHFNLVVSNMDQDMQLGLVDWIRKCNNREIDPDPSPTDHDLLAFFFKPRVTNIRGILTKRKNSYFIALFLDKHKYSKPRKSFETKDATWFTIRRLASRVYYDRERRELGFR